MAPGGHGHNGFLLEWKPSEGNVQRHPGSAMLDEQHLVLAREARCIGYPPRDAFSRECGEQRVHVNESGADGRIDVDGRARHTVGNHRQATDDHPRASG
jgi:hypothetical protein